MRRRPWYLLGSLLLAVGLLGLALASRDVIARWVHGEIAYRGRPLSFWWEEARRYERDQSANNFSVSWPLPAVPPAPPPPPWHGWTTQAVRWLGLQRPTYDDLWADEALPIVVELARDADPDVRSGIVMAWALQRHSLAARLSNPDARVRGHAASWIEQLNAALPLQTDPATD